MSNDDKLRFLKRQLLEMDDETFDDFQNTCGSSEAKSEEATVARALPVHKEKMTEMEAETLSGKTESSAAETVRQGGSPAAEAQVPFIKKTDAPD
mgnify:CR=1 FL=1